MLAGDYESAWQQSDEIRLRGSYDPHRVWDGTPVTGKRVMVRSVHGLGDAVQMLRYMPPLHREADKVILQVSPALVDLARLCPGVDEVVAWEQERPFDLQCEITELPYIFRSTLATLPTSMPYLDLPSSLVEGARDTLGEHNCIMVGVVWSASQWDKSRSIPLSLLLPLLDSQSDISFLSLQAATDNIEWERVCSERGWGSRRAGGESLVNLAAAITHMDLVITVDTLAAHLAGALGKATWVLLKSNADWRWMLDRDDSPWYPTMRLFRQRPGESWTPVIGEVARTLHTWVESSSAALQEQKSAC
jgi:hypothetical protein